jgi:hypothetical protein
MSIPPILTVLAEFYEHPAWLLGDRQQTTLE